MRGTTQRGVVMVIALIMLAIVTLIGTVSANIVMGNLQVVQNVEAAAAARNSAVSAIQEAIVTRGFFQGERAFVSGCQGDSYSRCFDMTGDGAIDDLKVTLTRPTCIASKPGLKRSPDVERSYDADGGMAQYCWGGGGQADPNEQTDPTNDCADVVWEVEVESEDQVTGARVRMRQAFSTRTDKDLIERACEWTGTSGS